MKTNNSLKMLSIEPEKQADSCIIWLHGLGADASDFYPIGKMLSPILAEHAIRWIFPQAPIRPVFINGGMPMPCWYDILAVNPSRVVNPQHVTEICAQINELINQQIALGIAANRILLAGFSQGGAVALECALTHPKALAGLMALSSYLIKAPKHVSHSELPILLVHGTEDMVVPIPLADDTLIALQKLGYTLQSHRLEMAHEVCSEEVDIIAEFIRRCLQR